MWKTALGWLPLGLLLPWSMTSLWNERWNRMSFGPFAFEADARSGNVFARFLLFYLSPLVFFIGGMVMAAMGMLAGYGIGGEGGAQIGGIIGMAGLMGVLLSRTRTDRGGVLRQIPP